VLKLKSIKCTQPLITHFTEQSGLMSKPTQVQDAHGVDMMQPATAIT
jgi:hypothetical protein